MTGAGANATAVLPTTIGCAGCEDCAVGCTVATAVAAGVKTTAWGFCFGNIGVGAGAGSGIGGGSLRTGAVRTRVGLGA